MHGLFECMSSGCVAQKGDHAKISCQVIQEWDRTLAGHLKGSAGILPQDFSVKMFDKQIKPILDYACEVCYMGKQDHDIEKIHLGYVKSLLNIKSSSCTPSVYA